MKNEPISNSLYNHLFKPKFHNIQDPAQLHNHVAICWIY